MFVACPEEKKVTYVVFMLVGEAEFWWHGTQQMMKAHGESLTWVNFKECFFGKYFSKSA